jgi:hypothetical protein
MVPKAAVRVHRHHLHLPRPTLQAASLTEELGQVRSTWGRATPLHVTNDPVDRPGFPGDFLDWAFFAVWLQHITSVYPSAAPYRQGWPKLMLHPSPAPGSRTPPAAGSPG